MEEPLVQDLAVMQSLEPRADLLKHHLQEQILLVLLHLAAILVYKFAKKTGLTKAMVTGRATEAPGKVSGADGGISRNRLAAGMALMAGLQLAAHALPLLRPAW